MGTRIQGLKSYKDEFSDTPKRERAYGLALEIRKFEIELYWKRATYFWTLIAATFAGYFALAAAKPGERHPTLIFLASCIGLVLSTSWYLVNRGSKYWQENWERHVDSLEDEFAGPLYKTTISKELFPARKLSGGYPFSVSRVNQLTSLFVALIWLAISVFSFPSHRSPARLLTGAPYVLAAFTMFFIFILIRYGRSEQTKERLIDFDKSAATQTEPKHTS